MSNLNSIAFDLGASNGRVILGEFDGTKLQIQEFYRFPNNPVETVGHLYWDILRLFWEMKRGLAKASHSKRASIASIGIDAWGVDYCLLDSTGGLLGNAYHYRDSRTEGMFEQAFARLSKEVLYKETGISFEKFNTLFQLLSVRKNTPGILAEATNLLFIPDILAFFLTGIKGTEYTTACTSQLMCAKQDSWNMSVLEAMEIPEEMLPAIGQPGSMRGQVLSTICDELSISKIPVVSVAGHDTASAIAAIPSLNSHYAFLSSGTWSLMGVEIDNPIITAETLEGNFSNERCFQGYSLLKNIMGMWLVQECKREWDTDGGKKLDYSDLEQLAKKSKPFLAFIDPNNDMFYTPGDMPKKIQKFCELSRQNVPQTKGEIVRCILESLALKYRHTFHMLEKLTSRTFSALHVAGGGSKNRVLNEFMANALDCRVISGPSEATAIGNLMVQLIALGEVDDLKQAREVVRHSFLLEEFVPKETSKWDEAYDKFVRLLENDNDVEVY